MTLASRPHSAPAGTTNEKIWSRASDASLHDGATRLTASVVEPMTRNSYGLLALSSAGVNVGGSSAIGAEHVPRRPITDAHAPSVHAWLAPHWPHSPSQPSEPHVLPVQSGAHCAPVHAVHSAPRAASSVQKHSPVDSLQRSVVQALRSSSQAARGAARQAPSTKCPSPLQKRPSEQETSRKKTSAVHGVRWPSCSGETASSASAPGRTGSAPS